MPGVFLDEFLIMEQQNTLFRGLAPAAAYTAPYLNDVIPVPANVFGDFGVDTGKAMAWNYIDWLFTLPLSGKAQATYTRQFNFSPGDEGTSFYGAVIYADFGANIGMYAERFPTPYIVPAGGGLFIWQFNLFLQGSCP